jgi:hypothetical protein
MEVIFNLLRLIEEINNPAIKIVIPAAAERRAGIQKKLCNYWIPA